MKIIIQKDKVQKAWLKFLQQKGDKLNISDHCLERIAQRFPEIWDWTKDEFLDRARKAKPLYLTIDLQKKRRGIVVRYQKITLAITFDTAAIMTVFKYRKKKIRKMKERKGGSKRNKHFPQPRKSRKQKWAKEVCRELSA